ncbi:MAG: DUF1579 family protein [Chloroflexi bacterium]|nr:DUF1579 family protein [Chloroflexota bacterium]
MSDPNRPLPDPDPHMAELDWFIGRWRVRSRLLTESGSWVEEDLTAFHTRELGGNLIFEHFCGPLNGKPFEAWSLRKFDASVGRWRQRWVDSEPGGSILNWVGAWDSEARRFTGYAERFVNADGTIAGDTAMREVFDDIHSDRFAWRYERTTDGGKTWDGSWKLDYVREDVS